LAQTTSSPTISLRDRSFSPGSSQERLGRWFVFSLLFHLLLIAGIFVSPMAPDNRQPVPVHVVDLVGGERIGATNLGTEVAPIQKQSAKAQQNSPNEVPEAKKEIKKKEEPQKEEKTKAKVIEKKPPAEEKLALKEKAKPETVKAESVKESRKEVKEEAGSEAASADSVRERLIQSAVDRAKNRTEAAQKSSKAEVLSAGSGEGDGAAGLGAGGRGSPTGVVKGMDFIIYQNRILATIKENWAWVGQRSNLRVVVQFGIKENGEIVGLRIVQPSGDPSYDESVLRALKKSNPLPAPPENYRKDFADVEISFRPRDLGA
jgi:colicin import membrane protein